MSEEQITVTLYPTARLGKEPPFEKIVVNAEDAKSYIEKGWSETKPK